MPKTITLLRIFIASPSDLNIERDIINEVVAELNISYSQNKDIKLEVIEWKTHVHPGIGEDGQDVINRQINDDYDIFIGLMWSKFGSTTKRDSSGTKEEFERAFNRYSKNKTEISILQYFKNSPISFDDIDPDQIKQIKAFKEDLKSRGVLFGHFSQPDEFEKLFRLNLILLLNNILSNNNVIGTNVALTIPKSDSVNIFKEDEQELGMFEYIDNTVQYMRDSQLVLSRITKYISDLGLKVSKKSEKLNALNAKSPDVKTREGRKLIDLLAVDMFNFNQRVKIEIPILNEQFSNAIKNFNNAIQIFNSFNENSPQKEEIENSLIVLRTAIEESMHSIELMRTSVIDTPSLTTKYSKAKKETGKLLLEFTDELNSYINLTDELLKTLNNIA